jgi:hypothetical protein
MHNAAWEIYRQEGYFIGKGLLPLAAVDATVCNFNQLIIQQLARLETPCSDKAGSKALFQNMQFLFQKDLPAYFASIRLAAKLFSLQALLMSPGIEKMVRAFGIDLPAFQTTPVLHIMAPSLKVPEGYYGFGVHQDWTALQSSLDTITVWVPFTHVDRNSYPMEVIPRSHLNGLLPGKQTEHIVEVDPRYYDESAFIPLEAEPGDVIFMSNFTVHRSSKQGDERLRLSVSTRYENAAEKTFIDRVYPYTQKRTMDRTVLHPGFPDADAVKNLYRG